MIRRLFSGLMMGLALTSPAASDRLPALEDLVAERFPGARAEGTPPDEVTYLDGDRQVLARLRTDGVHPADATLYDPKWRPVLALRGRLSIGRRYLYLDQFGKLLCKVVVEPGEKGAEARYQDGSGRPISEAGLFEVLRAHVTEVFPTQSRRELGRLRILSF